MCYPVNVANKRLTVGLSPLDATLTKTMGGLPPEIDSPAYSASPRFDLPSLSTYNLNLTTYSRELLARPCYTVPPMARQRLGQHFLADLHWREEIARAIRVSPTSTVPLPQDDQHCWIEIGSGHGEMTHHLLATPPPVPAIQLAPPSLPPLP